MRGFIEIVKHSTVVYEMERFISVFTKQQLAELKALDPMAQFSKCLHYKNEDYTMTMFKKKYWVS